MTALMRGSLTLARWNLKRFPGCSAAGSSTAVQAMRRQRPRGSIAGINAARKIQGEGADLFMDRSEAYIGVLIDDLVTKENREPYRMMTSRAEYRLLLRTG